MNYLHHIKSITFRSNRAHVTIDKAAFEHCDVEVVGDGLVIMDRNNYDKLQAAMIAEGIDSFAHVGGVYEPMACRDYRQTVDDASPRGQW